MLTHENRMTKPEPPHITVCICTYKRPTRLGVLLTTLQSQATRGAFTYSIVVVDNDIDTSAQAVVAACGATAVVPIEYYCQAQKNIALTRNKAVEHARGQFFAFIDDDEVPVDDWLHNLHATSCRYEADAVLGPVRPRFECDPPPWIVRAQLFERPSYPTGTVLPWNETRTGNVLFRASVFETRGHRFRPEFRHSEDQDFFKRIIAQGCLVLWCDEAPVYEVQGPERFTIGYFLKRSLLRGNVSLKLRSSKLRLILKSSAAFLIYSVSLPVLLLVRQDLFIAYLIKDCDHIGRLLAACRIDIQEYLA
jgi:succinoglycan biosynthesis protein ExoM